MAKSYTYPANTGAAFAENHSLGIYEGSFTTSGKADTHEFIAKRDANHMWTVALCANNSSTWTTCHPEPLRHGAALQTDAFKGSFEFNGTKLFLWFNLPMDSNNPDDYYVAINERAPKRKPRSKAQQNRDENRPF